MKNNYAYVSSMKKIFTHGLRIKLESMRDPYAVPDGSDDTVMSFYKFAKNYSFGIGVEMKGGIYNDLCDSRD